MYHTTGFTPAAMRALYATLNDAYPQAPRIIGRPPALTREEEIRVAVIYQRRNRTQHELAETFGASQASISRAIARWIPRINATLGDLVPTVDDLDPRDSLIIDGTLVPCWDWAKEENLYSGKHHTTGLNLQVAATLCGTLAWVSDPMPGCTHDSKAIDTTGILDHFPAHTLVGDKGYIGKNMITPHRKPAGGQLTENQKEFNKVVNSIRAAVERAIAHLKTWRILHTAYRRPLHTFHETISAVIALEFFRMSFE